MLRVLIVDDEPVIADSLAYALSDVGYDATAVYDGQEALKSAAVLNPDVLISDVVMPGLNGIEAGIQIRRMLPSCRIILLSGQAATRDLARDAKVRGHHFEIVTKPVHPKAMLAYLTRSVSGSDADLDRELGLKR
jgi:CheY-like chemotaxis protein